MFGTDVLFLGMLIGIIFLPLASVYPDFRTFPYELFLLGISSASVVILTWERVADKRRILLEQLMRRVYSDGGEIGLHSWIVDLHNRVARSQSLEPISLNMARIERAAFILKRSGMIYRIDHVYPRNVIRDLEKIVDACREYDRKWRSPDKVDPELKKRILDGFLRIRNTFVEYMERHGIEPPMDSDYEWVEKHIA